MQHDLLGLDRDLDLRSNFKLTFRGHVIYHLNRLDEVNTMIPISFFVAYIDKKLLAENRFPEKGLF